ncbi:uncharacterized protein BX664DRAFT_354252 [Halteromyces radiatus]|uniref:uncharacterized protein n=1 Tax=Halteromyces radiatus TaxID=101107 RepID=UPI00222001CE|nr:uncharacterized protein BX664DRAFT_354252 [Halteromyces radiatus]KAI8098723.1 hypothetical protein BX664DRAFT_354252 [Halteromyces radiatus]
MSKIARPPLPTTFTSNSTLLATNNNNTSKQQDDYKTTSNFTKSLATHIKSTSHNFDELSSSQDKDSLVVDARVSVPTLNLVGTLRFIGETHFKPGIWTGIELDTIGTGKNNGTVQGVQYFSCPEQTGLFVLASKVICISDPKSIKQRSGRERIKTHVKPVPSKSAHVSTKSISSSTKNQTTPLPLPTATKRSITTRLPSNKSSISTRSPKTRASASPVMKRPSTSPTRQRSSALPSVKRSSTSSSSNTTTSESHNISNKRASAVRISSSNPVVHIIDPKKKDLTNDYQQDVSSGILSSSPSSSSLSSPHTPSTATTSASSTSTTATTLNTSSSTSPPPPPSSSSPNNNKPLINMDEMHQLYDLLQRTQREKDILVEQMQNKDAAFERLVSAKESYALQVEDKEQAMNRLQQQMISQQSTIDDLTQELSTYKEKAAQQVRDDATEEQYARRVTKLETLVATLQEQAGQAAQTQEQRAREHAGQLNSLRNELEQEKQLSLSLEKECDTLRKTGLEAIHAYEQSVAQLKQDHSTLLDEKDTRLRQTQSALDNLKRQLHTFDADGTDDNDDLMMMIGQNNNGSNNYDEINDDDESSSLRHHRLSSQHSIDARSWSEQRHRLEDQLDLTMTELENERATMRTLMTELESLREELQQSRRHQHTLSTQYSALQQEMAKEIDDKRRLMEEADAAFEAQAKAEDDLYQMKMAHASMEKEWQQAIEKLEATTKNPDSDRLAELEQQSAHWKDQYHSMEQECMRLMDEMLAMADDNPKKEGTVEHPNVKQLEQQLEQAKQDHEQELLRKQIEIQKLGKELADLEALVETNVFGQGDAEDQLEKERDKVRRLEKQLARLSSSSSSSTVCELCGQLGHDLLSCQNYKQDAKNLMYCEYCDADGDHLTQDCPDQDETF